MNTNMIPLSRDDAFRFSCSKHVSCFNQCCRDLNQFLTPYDILRLKNRLGISSSLFLDQYTTQHLGPESGLPVVTLKPNDADELKCLFVTPSGCSVYEDRPSSCRAYPLVRVVSRSRETGKISESYMLLRELHCRGFDQEHTQTVREWIEDQSLTKYNEINDLLLEIISLKNRLIPGPVDIKSKYLFNMACYDLDRFRSHIFDKGILDDLNLDGDTLEVIKNDDVALLKLGLKWIKQIFF